MYINLAVLKRQLAQWVQVKSFTNVSTYGRHPQIWPTPAEFSSSPNQTHLSILIRVFEIIRKSQVGEFSCGSVVEHCVCSTKGCGFDSQGTHIMKKMYSLNAL